MKKLLSHFKSRPKVVTGAVIAVVLIALIIALVFTAHYWLAPTLVVAVIVWWVCDNYKQRKAADDERDRISRVVRDQKIFEIIFDVASALAPRIGVVTPRYPADIRVKVLNPNVWGIAADKLSNTLIAPTDLDLMAQRLNLAFASRYNDDVKLDIYSLPLFADKIVDHDTYIIIRIIICDTEKAADYVNRIRQSKKPNVPTDDEDY